MLYDEIQALDPALLAIQDYQAIADALNVGRVKIVPRLGGIGLVLETLGPGGGAALLDGLQAATAADSALKWAWVLLERGELDFGSSATRQKISELVPSPAKELLLATAEQPDPVTALQVATIMTGGA